MGLACCTNVSAYWYQIRYPTGISSRSRGQTEISATVLEILCAVHLPLVSFRISTYLEHSLGYPPPLPFLSLKSSWAHVFTAPSHAASDWNLVTGFQFLCLRQERFLPLNLGDVWPASAQSLSHIQLCDPMGWGPPGSSVHGILQARILERVAMPSSRGSSQPRDQAPVSRIAGGFFTV